MVISNGKQTVCPFCKGKTRFEVVEEKSIETNLKFHFLRCEGCKSFLGILNKYKSKNLKYLKNFGDK